MAPSKTNISNSLCLVLHTRTSYFEINGLISNYDKISFFFKNNIRVKIAISRGYLVWTKSSVASAFHSEQLKREVLQMH